MPTYSYCCSKCDQNFELFFYIKDYIDSPSCINCKSSKTYRLYSKDILTQSTSVKKADSELKTIGDLAKRNTDKMSEDHKQSLYEKHNSYKYEESQKILPQGMNRIKKPPKPKWPGAKIKSKRNTKK